MLYILRPHQDDASDDVEDTKIDIKQEFDADVATSSTQQTITEDTSPTKRCRNDEYNFAYDASTILHLLREIRDLTKSREHPITTFFESMAKTVMQFPPARAAETKLKVCQIVTEMECRILEESGNYPANMESFE